MNTKSTIIVIVAALFSVPLLAQEPEKKQPPPPKPLPKAPAGILFERDVVYGKTGDVELKLNLARPETTDGPRPCVLVIHGGGWAAGDRIQHDKNTWDFVQRGYVSATIGYRFAPKYLFPAQVEDVKCAVRFLRANAEKFGIDPERFGAVGFSAGGHLSLMLGVMDKADGFEGDGGWADQSSKVQTVVNFFGPTDLTMEYPEASRGIVKNWIGGTMAEKPDAYKAASPVTYINTGDAPILSFQGTKDHLVPHNQVYRLTDVMTAAGVAGRAEFLVGAGHGAPLFDWQYTSNEMFAFFEKQLRPKKPAPKTAN